jgi:hypothetical protein
MPDDVRAESRQPNETGALDAEQDMDAGSRASSGKRAAAVAAVIAQPSSGPLPWKRMRGASADGRAVAARSMPTLSPPRTHRSSWSGSCVVSVDSVAMMHSECNGQAVGPDDPKFSPDAQAEAWYADGMHPLDASSQCIPAAQAQALALPCLSSGAREDAAAAAIEERPVLPDPVEAIDQSTWESNRRVLWMFERDLQDRLCDDASAAAAVEVLASPGLMAALPAEERLRTEHILRRRRSSSASIAIELPLRPDTEAQRVSYRQLEFNALPRLPASALAALASCMRHGP